MPKKSISADDDESCQTEVGRTRSRPGAKQAQGSCRSWAGAGQELSRVKQSRAERGQELVRCRVGVWKEQGRSAAVFGRF